MVIVGGITRLTQSGLSMVEWHLIVGSIPPITDADWLETFEKYQATPEFQIVNPDFTVEEFKTIFWWEYIHRVLGRLIGLAFLIPFVIFVFQRRIPSKLLPKLLIMFALGAFQGFMGWFMVKSGLVDKPSVSHLRLAAHLLTAFITFGFVLWVALDMRMESGKPIVSRTVMWLTRTALALLVIQVIYGAFVAGLKAGLFYNTWPTMNGEMIPQELGDSIGRDGLTATWSNITVIQFIHRWLAFLFLGVVVWLLLEVRKPHSDGQIVRLSRYLLGGTTLQVLLGIITLVMAVPLGWGVLHQLVALVLFAILIALNQRIGGRANLAASQVSDDL